MLRPVIVWMCLAWAAARLLPGPRAAPSDDYYEPHDDYYYEGGTLRYPKCHVLYLNADQDLEGAIVNDLEELMSNKNAMLNPDYNVLVYIDRNSGVGLGTSSNAVSGLLAEDGATPATYYTGSRYIKKHKSNLMVAKEVGEQASDDPDVMRAYFDWAFSECRRTDPEAEVIVTLSSHGNGKTGFGGDSDTAAWQLGDEKTVILWAQIRNVIRGAMDAATPPIDTLALLGFDACLMQTFTGAETFHEITKMLMGSQTTEPAHGWDYSTFDTRTDVESMAQSIIQEFVLSKHGLPTHQTPKTLSLLHSVDIRDWARASTVAGNLLIVEFEDHKQHMHHALHSTKDIEVNELSGLNMIDYYDLLLTIRSICRLYDARKQSSTAATPPKPCSENITRALDEAGELYAKMLSNGYALSTEKHAHGVGVSWNGLRKCDGAPSVCYAQFRMDRPTLNKWLAHPELVMESGKSPWVSLEFMYLCWRLEVNEVVLSDPTANATYHQRCVETGARTAQWNIPKVIEVFKSNWADV